MPETGIEEDIACMGCGYNLRGLLADGKCPECGGAIAPSLERRPFGGWSLGRLRWIRRGMTLLLVVAAYRILMAATLGYVAFRILLWKARVPGLDPPLLDDLYSTLSIVGVVIAEWLAFLILSLRAKSENQTNVLKWTRIVVSLCVVIALGWSFEARRERLTAPDISFILVENILLAVLSFFWLRSASELARKAMDETLANRASILSFVIACLNAIGAVWIGMSQSNNHWAIQFMMAWSGMGQVSLILANLLTGYVFWKLRRHAVAAIRRLQTAQFA